MSYRSLAQSYRLGVTTVAEIIQGTTTAIWFCLCPLYLKKPTRESSEQTAQGYLTKCNFPNVIGSIDGKHIRIQAPPKSGSNFFNYKHFFSIVLQGVADSDLKFIAVEVGAFGKESDGGIFARSDTKLYFEQNSMGLPDTVPLPDSSASIPYVLLGDAAYPLKPYLVTPFSGVLARQQRIFNYRHSIARRCVECAFGVLAAKWRVLKTTIATDLETTEKIVLAAVVLHNAIITLEGCSASEKDVEMWEDNHERVQVQTGGLVHRGRPTQYGSWIREKLVTYFNTSGAVPWQEDYI